MAPSRRKGTSKAAAAAAACRQWKVGDLVLAKVKGFPAWPATVSEPGKWGYPAVWKKVLVYFFGTQQIAFCNPADVEAFTEEKKQSLLVKRHGKGADFVRAVQEIIDSYEKLKKQDQLMDEFNSKEVPCTKNENLVESSAKNGSKDHTEAHEVTLDSRLNSSHLTAERDEQTLLVEGTSATTQTNAILNKEEPADTAVVAEIPLASSRRRSKDIRSQRRVLHKEESTFEGRRSSSRVGARRLRSSAELGKDSSRSAVIGSLRRNKRNRKSPDISECDDVYSSAFVLSGSIEDNGSEIVTVDCDTCSHNEGSTTDSGCKLERSETIVECLEGDVQLNKGLDVQIKAVVIKKRRKPNRKRLTTDGDELAIKIDKEPVIDVSMHNTSETSENTHQQQDQVNRICFKEDGDEHLPLVKRARVRMGKSSSAMEELISLPHTEEINQKEVVGCPSGPINTSLNCDMDSFADADPFVANGALDKISSQVCTQSPGNQLNFLSAKKDHSFSCLVDGEAVLPPSKRLHRALEAMSANAAEESQTCTDASSSMKTLYNNSLASVSRCPRVTLESRTSNDLGVQDMDLVNTDAQHVDASKFSPSSDPVIFEENTESSMESDLHYQIDRTNVQNNESREVSQDAEDHHGDCKNSNVCDGICTVVTAVQDQSPTHYPLSNIDQREVDGRHAQCSVDESLPLNDESNAKTKELSNHKAEDLDKKFDASEQHNVMSVDPASSSGDDTVNDLPKDDTSVVPFSAEDAGCETRSLESHLIDKREVNDMSQHVDEFLDKQGKKDPSSISFPNGNLGDGCIIRTSSCLTDGNDFLGQGSPPNTLTGTISTSDNSYYFQTNGSCSPDAHLHRKPKSCTPDGKFESVMAEKPKSLGKNPDQHAAFSSFETMLGTLTRTKESIGRATRVAIDCAKFGAASKVLEILVRSLEAETSLHRRVDLFFLVDSILKGDVGGFFPSVIQANLRRLLSATAPPGNSAHENRLQCLKVLRLWLARRILPESVIRHHIRELDSLCGSSGVYSRRSSRTERSLDDPLREMEGMLVDEYGSNSSFQLPGFCMPRMLKDEDEGSDSDGENFEAVTPEHDLQNPEENEIKATIVKHRHILEDVDGELEMEDVAPPCETELVSCSGGGGGGAAQISHYQFERHHPLPFAPPLPHDVPPSSPPLPLSPPPLPRPPSSLPPCSVSNSYTSDINSILYPDQHRMPEHMVQSVAQQSNAPRINNPVSDAACYPPPPEYGDLRGQMTDSTSSSFNSFSVQPVRNVPQTDGASFHNKAYTLRPPHPPPMNQFTYVQEDQHFKHRRESVPPSYSNRFHSMQNGDRENFYNNHERMKPGPYEPRESWRFPPHSFSGPRYPDKGRSYGHASYAGPPCEPSRYPSQGWRSPPRSMSRRNSMPHFRPPFEGPIPTNSKGPGYWRPR